MLTEKDYCDYDTSRELKELGFVAGLGENDCGYCLYDDAWHDQVNRPLLYEAQKWLREEKQIIIEATFNLMYKGQPRFSWRVLYNLAQHKGAYYTFDSVKSKEDYVSYEEALSEGIKEVVKTLKEE